MTDPVRHLGGYNGLWIAPGSPYRSMTGALAAIAYARTSGVPLIGTCGGFQHIIVEYARNVLDFPDADHAESNPYASTLFVTPLCCSLVGKSMSIQLAPESIARRCYDSSEVEEDYYCNFGLNPAYESHIVQGGLRVSGRDSNGEARIVELSEHPFFVGTLFVPQTRSSADRQHPLVAGYLRAVQISVGEPVS